MLTIEKRFFERSYKIYGKGKNAYFAFHGFGQSPSVFKDLSLLIPDSKIYSFQLFGHEQQTNKTKSYPNKEEWITFFKDFVDSLSLKSVHLLAHSLGARHVWAILELFPEKVSKVFLIAPNGLEHFNLFDFCTNTRIGNTCFDFFLNYYDSFDSVLKLVMEIPPLKKLILFAQSQTNTKEKRHILRRTWLAYGRFNVHWNRIAQNLEQFQIPVEVILARNDQLINNKILTDKFKNIASAEVKYIETSHYQVLKEWIDNFSLKK